MTATSSSGGERAEIEQRLAAYKTASSAFAGKPEAKTFDQLIKAEEDKLKQLGAGKAIGYKELAEWLASLWRARPRRP